MSLIDSRAYIDVFYVFYFEKHAPVAQRHSPGWDLPQREHRGKGGLDWLKPLPICDPDALEL